MFAVGLPFCCVVSEDIGGRGKRMSDPGFEPGLSRPQRDVLTARRIGRLLVYGRLKSAVAATSPSRVRGSAIELQHKASPLNTTPVGFEPTRAEPNGFLVHLLNHSDTVSRNMVGRAQIGIDTNVRTRQG